LETAPRHLVLQLQAAHLRHVNVEQQAGARRVRLPREKFAAGGEGLCLVAGALDQHGERIAHGVVVVKNEDGSVLGHGGPQDSSGSAKTKDVPPPSRGEAQIRPPCASMMDRQIDSPTPMPRTLVVTNGWNRF